MTYVDSSAIGRLTFRVLFIGLIPILTACSSAPQQRSQVRQPIDPSRIIDVRQAEDECIESAGNFTAEKRLTEFLQGKAIMAIIDFDKVREGFGPEPRSLIAQFKRRTPSGDSYLLTSLSLYGIDQSRASGLERGRKYQILAYVYPSSSVSNYCDVFFGHFHKGIKHLSIMLESRDSVIRPVEQ